MFDNAGFVWKVGMGIGAAVLGGSAVGAGISSFRNSRIPGGGFAGSGYGGDGDFEGAAGEDENFEEPEEE